ncbi:MAG TPA: bifunctional (p)ppGpp synthetase/guanosine-3',5'-bis(diphosphate) 3'-pyrophosphohydrolase [Limnochordia bacterium]|nr:bifunctional (p)ppGpp synthetase/guanosine-3',5'-bis(diphosphate) 3'-pyrophosphohydrolase [Limnochordia bacterium]
MNEIMPAERQIVPSEIAFDVLAERVRAYQPHADLAPLAAAFDFSETAHRGQLRDSGERYFRHPFEVALILADFELDLATIAGGLLHDVLEDTEITLDQLERRFGAEIAGLVDGVTKLAKLPFRTVEEQQAENLRKMFLAMAKDLRVVLIKLADRLHNMRTLHHLPLERRRKVTLETLEIYAPLAHRLGMWELKWELEDLSLRYLDPPAYYDLVGRLNRKRSQRQDELSGMMESIVQRLGEAGIDGEVFGRPKHLYSIYQKMRRQRRDFSEIYDLLAVRVIVESVKDCYGALGIVHTLWKPMPGRFKDYIAMPKSNMYQSLHTTVIGPRGEPFEIQIRTWEMHRIAEKGIAAHWAYKEGHKATDSDRKVAWLREVMDWLQELRDPHDFMETLKIDLFEDEVFVFTPKGDVMSLPTGSTPVDFAFAVHTQVGMACAGAKVNGRIVPLDYRLTNGEFVEVLTSKNAAPTADWLKFVKTSKARSRIRASLKDERREQHIQQAKAELVKEIERQGLDPKEALAHERLLAVAKKYGMSELDDFHAAIGAGKIGANQVVSRLIGQSAREERLRQARALARQEARRRTRGPSQGVTVLGEQDMLVRFGRCCNPVPGDGIVGYITRGRGVSVHRNDCPNIGYLQGNPERQVAVQWDVATGESYPVEIEVEADDRVNLLSNIMQTVSEGHTNIEAVNARTVRNKFAIVNLVVDIDDVEHMSQVISRVSKIKGVRSVRRAHPS